MKIKFLAIICVALAGLSGFPSAKAVNTSVVAVAVTASDLISNLVDTFNAPAMKQQLTTGTNGLIDGVIATSSGNTVIIKFSFSENINLANFNEQQKEEFIKSFTNAVFKSAGADSIAVLKEYDISLKVVFQDKFSHSVSTTI